MLTSLKMFLSLIQKPKTPYNTAEMQGLTSPPKPHFPKCSVSKYALYLLSGIFFVRRPPDNSAVIILCCIAHSRAFLLLSEICPPTVNPYCSGYTYLTCYYSVNMGEGEN